MYATYHKDVSIHKDALKFDNPKLIDFTVLKDEKQVVSNLLQKRFTRTLDYPLVVAVNSNEYYNFYYLDNGDRIDITRTGATLSYVERKEQSQCIINFFIKNGIEYNRFGLSSFEYEGFYHWHSINLTKDSDIKLILKQIKNNIQH